MSETWNKTQEPCERKGKERKGKGIMQRDAKTSNVTHGSSARKGDCVYKERGSEPVS
jgi:hypothetical protein